MSVIEVENFQPNLAARALVTRRSEIIGAAIPTNENIFFADNSYHPMLLAGMSEATHERDYALLLWAGEVAFDDKRWLRKISNKHLMDGLIVASLVDGHPLFAYLLNLGMPFVMIDRPLRDQDRIHYVTVDNVQAGEVATQHLISLGRQRIAHISGHLDIGDAQDRLKGYKAALQKAGRPIDPDLIYEGKFSRVAGYEGMLHLAQHKPDAVFAASDTVAIGVLRAAHELGLHVPDDLAVIGFDDIDVALQSNPLLTTIRQPVREKGAKAAELLIDLIEGRLQGIQQIILPTELVIRQSCGGISVGV